MANEEGERIYIGGLDPSRGLTVELVASRLRSVKCIEILSINDVAVATDDDDNNKSSMIYNSKRAIVDEDGDLVDTRNFFFLEARRDAAATAASTSEGPSAMASATALDLIAKQYHGVKWKGCHLRVEAAKPHILKRLEEERTLRSNEQERMANAHIMTDVAEDKVVKHRRRLRIRKRFGEEAFHVDTLPHPLELSRHQIDHDDDIDGWDQFVALHQRMHDKRQSQQKKLAERRKDERRLWASSKGSGKNKHPPVAGSMEGSDDLRSLIFLNRGIHIRFGDDMREGAKSDVVAVKPAHSIAEEKESVVSSPSADWSSDSDESSENQKETKDKDETRAYIWSDDDEEDNLDVEGDVESHANSDESDDDICDDERHKSGQYAWSDEDDKDINVVGDDQSSNEGTGERCGTLKPEGRKKMMDGMKYTNAVAMDEFSGGMDFDAAPVNFENDASDSEPDGRDENQLGSDSGSDASQCCLEDDIRSNIDILSKMFPGKRFEAQPLAAAMDAGRGDANEGAAGGVGEQLGKRKISSPFGAGLIMQRYDPTKESDKRFEMPQVRKHDSDSNVKHPSGEEHDKSERGTENSRSLKGDETPVSSEISDKDRSEDLSSQPLQEGTKLGGDIPEESNKACASKNKIRAATNVEGDVVAAKDVYEQDKLEDIFKQAQKGNQESFSLANLFQTKENIQGSNKEEKAEDSLVSEQDEPDSISKQARGDTADKVTGARGFSFGFQSQLPEDIAADSKHGSGSSFSFGFDLGNTSKIEQDLTSSQKNLEQDLTGCGQKSETFHTTTIANVAEETPKKHPQAKGRVGMRFPESVLDEYENMFFSLNEGPQILKDLHGMKQDGENQEKWQKEREVLTADWKRKKKTGLSRKVKRVRRL